MLEVVNVQHAEPIAFHRWRLAAFNRPCQPPLAMCSIRTVIKGARP